MSNLDDFAKRYAEAWCSRNLESVATFFAKNATLRVNGGPLLPVLEIVRGSCAIFPTWQSPLISSHVVTISQIPSLTIPSIYWLHQFHDWR
jgi:hypothetical protein